MITAERARELFNYCADTGALTWRRARGSRPSGVPAGTVKIDGPRRYLNVQADGKMYKAHRLAWLIAHGEIPTLAVDHVNGNGLDNRLCNLRLATGAQNAANDKNRKPGRYPRGVVYDARSKRFCAKAFHGGRHIHLGSFKTADDAGAAYAQWRQQTFGEFAHV